MGAEYLVFAAAALGGVALTWLLYLSYKASTRPYAIPTLLFSCLAGVWSALGKPTNHFHLHFAIGFLLGVVLFGLHAAVIKKLLGR
jgi:uncharacterized membrane protein